MAIAGCFRRSSVPARRLPPVCLVSLSGSIKKPVLVQTVYARHDIPALSLLREESVPYYESVEITCRAMAALVEVGQFLANYS